ncbi:MAG TPA: tRNA pseudouridine(38-40) synthase TruA [Alphaproteobacteria bacterium]
MTQRWKITVEYDGRAFSGWQKQPHHVSVQGAIETALLSLTGQKIGITVAGRTDAGVHGRGQVAHFDMDKVMTPERLRLAINALVRPHPIVAVKVEQVAPDFHARFQADARTYQYRIINRRTPLTFDKGLAWQVHHPLDVEAMQKASRCLLGKHDFTSFRAMGCQAKHPIRSINSFDFEQRGDEILITINAKSFLYHQVRNMVGTLVKIGIGDWSWEKMQEILEAKDRTIAGITAPADGLYFMSVTYPNG